MANKVKILLFTEFGGVKHIPYVLRDKMEGKSFDEQRTGEIVDFIERTAVPCGDAYSINNPQSLAMWFREYGDDKIMFYGKNEEKGEEKFAALGQIYGMPAVIKFTIKEIDPTFEWLLSEYEGAEFLQKHESVERISQKYPIWRMNE